MATVTPRVNPLTFAGRFSFAPGTSAAAHQLRHSQRNTPFASTANIIKELNIRRPL
jgi:hypothetical protein